MNKILRNKDGEDVLEEEDDETQKTEKLGSKVLGHSDFLEEDEN